MDVLNELHLIDGMHTISQALLVPVVVLLVLLVVYAAFALGSLVVELAKERRHYSVELPKLIDELEYAPVDDMPDVVARSGLLDDQKERVDELVSYMHLPQEALTEVARRLLGDESEGYTRSLARTDTVAKVAPMLGLMGTLIPLGPGIVGLSGGDLGALSQSLLVAFDTTVTGLAAAVVCYFVSKCRRRWYRGYLSDMEGLMNTIIEKAGLLHEGGFPMGGSGGSSDAREGGGTQDAA